MVKRIEPPKHPDDEKPTIGQFDAPQKAKGSTAAAEIIRRKIDKLYRDEPDATQEIAEANLAKPRSKHQEFMYQLSTSGKGLAEIQTEWHAYYAGLPDHEKHEVWQEFYQAHDQMQQASQITPATPQVASLKAEPTPSKPKSVVHHEEAIAAQHAKKPVKTRRARTSKNAEVQALKRQVIAKVAAGAEKTKNSQGFRSAAFGITMGVVMMFVLLLGLFNELVITPFIQPNRQAEATPIIFNSDTVAASTDPEVVIPKINVQIPVDYSVPNNQEETIQEALNDAVVHYPNTVKPGEKGNVALFGHSSNNIFNKGKYKFAFVLLSQMQNGDVFYLTYGGKVYAYKVFDKKIVEPNETWVLNPVAGKDATAALITCDPPGTSLRRLVVWGEQISPDPNGNIAAAPAAEETKPAAIASNGPTLFGRFIDWANPLN